MEMQDVSRQYGNRGERNKAAALEAKSGSVTLKSELSVVFDCGQISSVALLLV